MKGVIRMMQEIITHHFVKSEDLNHHGTLFAGRTAEWFIEAGLMAAAQYLDPANIVCAKVHGMHFQHPIQLGAIIKFVSRAVYAGTSSLIVNVVLYNEDVEILNDFISFVHVDEKGKATPHHVVITAETEEEKKLQEKAIELKKNR